MIEQRDGACGDPTPHASVNAFVAELHRRMREVLGDALVGLYLDGSLALGGFDADSDIDFVAVTRRRISHQTFLQLQAVHRELARLDSPWAVQHEGSYLSRAELRRYDPARSSHPNIERGAGEILKWATHDAVWNVHRRILRERGIVVYGPPPVTLVDPVDGDELRAAMRRCLGDWPGHLLQYPHRPIGSAGYQSYIVLTLCRMLCTIETGEIRSKRNAAQWAIAALGEPWAASIAWAWSARSHPEMPTTADDETRVRAFIALALERSRPLQ
jgi:hypothetical protein